MKSVDEQLEVIGRGIHQIEPTDGLRTKLEKSIRTGRPLRVKYGIDPQEDARCKAAGTLTFHLTGCSGDFSDHRPQAGVAPPVLRPGRL